MAKKKDESYIPEDAFPVPGQKYICARCGKEFTATDKHRYRGKNGWICSWECFKSNFPKVEAEFVKAAEPKATTNLTKDEWWEQLKKEQRAAKKK